jgi:hypothetical protein
MRDVNWSAWAAGVGSWFGRKTPPTGKQQNAPHELPATKTL